MPPTISRTAHRTPDLIRRGLAAVFLLGSIGLMTELLLLGHYEDWEQWVPLAFLGFGLAASIWTLISRGRRGISFMRVLGILYVIVGVVGVALHVNGNRLFELEMYPGMRGARLLMETLTGATPALAPGAMIQLGLVALLYAFRNTGPHTQA